MNTPRTKKRFVGILRSKLTHEDYEDGLTNPEYAIVLAGIVSEFEHLELAMSIVIRDLLGSDRPDTGGYILRALPSTQARIGLMRQLLEKAPRNARLGDEYDEVLTQFDEVRSKRNGYVHGLWFTTTSGKVEWARRTEDGFGFLDAEPHDKAKLDALLKQIRDLIERVYQVELARRKGLREEHP